MWNAAAILLCLVLALPWHAEARSEASKPLPAQTDVERAQHHFDADGVPLLEIAGHGRQRHPAWIALYALAYAGVDAYEPTMEGLKNEAKFKASVNWLTANLKQKQGGLWVWEYGFDSTYNDISIKAPWSSAFAQATGIQALLASWRVTGNPGHLSQALKAAEALYVPLAKGGFLFQRGQDIWFEEIPSPVDNPGHILNGHMRALLALKELADASGDKRALDHYQRGKETLLRWLPLYDTGYWLRYDLNPRKRELLFRIVNPYGFAAYALAIDRISLRDPVSGKAVVLEVGDGGDALGDARIAGVDWGQAEVVEGRPARRLVPKAIEPKVGEKDEGRGPHSYFYLALPDKWRDNLRQTEYELELEYLDDKVANLAVQQRSIAPGVEFRDMRDGDLHLTGTKKWRKWKIPLRVGDLGWWVGSSYAEKHVRYLKKLASGDARFRDWVTLGSAYKNAASAEYAAYRTTEAAELRLPRQTPMVPYWSLGADGIVRYHLADEKSRFDLPGNLFNPKSSIGTPVVSPYVVAQQLLLGGEMPSLQASFMPEGRIPPEKVTRDAALAWFLDPKNRLERNGAITYQFNFDNVYNDVISKAPWGSAFSQAYIAKAMASHLQRDPHSAAAVQQILKGVVRSFELPVADGGVSSFDKAGNIFFEEVPRATHILNAHLIGVNELYSVGRQLADKRIIALADGGKKTLRQNLHRFDTGYWMRYDQNPRKEILLQIDWLEASRSPLIESVSIANPGNLLKSNVRVGEDPSFDGPNRISGGDWLVGGSADGVPVRSFQNGYAIRAIPVQGGTRHNVYVVMRVPDSGVDDYFSGPSYQVIIRYKDVAPGKFLLKAQTINDGQTLQFAPLRSGVWVTVGDGRWKQQVVELRQQDLGWFKGVDYQEYEVEELKRLAVSSRDWFIGQFAERQAFYLSRKLQGLPVIDEPARNSQKISATLSLTKSSSTYPNHGFENALDGDPNDDYVAGIESDKSAFAEFTISPKIKPSELRVTWENSQNFARTVKVYAYSSREPAKELLIGGVDGVRGPTSRVPLHVEEEIGRIKVVFSDFAGQPRLLLRLMEIR